MVILIIGFVVFLLIGALIYVIASKDKMTKKPIKTLQDACDQPYEEPESRYKSVTVSLPGTSDNDRDK